MKTGTQLTMTYGKKHKHITSDTFETSYMTLRQIIVSYLICVSVETVAYWRLVMYCIVSGTFKRKYLCFRTVS